MHRQQRIATLLLAVIASSSACAQISDAQKKFVYLLRVTQPSRKVDTVLTGFRLQGLDGIVTCLHGVVGATSIIATNSYDPFALKNLAITLVDPEHDLAVLQLKGTDLSNGLQRGPDTVLAGTALRIVGHPAGISDYDHPGSASSPAEKTVSDLIPDQSRVRFEKRNSPIFSAPVLGLDAALAPGDSGAPVFTKDGRVIAVADGGLMNGASSISWAMPLRNVNWIPADSQKGQNEIKRLQDLPRDNLYSYNFSETADTAASLITPDLLFRSLRKNVDPNERKVKFFWHFNQWLIWFDLPTDLRGQIASVTYSIEGLQDLDEAWVPDIGLYGWNGKNCTEHSSATVYLNSGQAPIYLPFNLCIVPSATVPTEAEAALENHR